jgi:hypothetical protein
VANFSQATGGTSRWSDVACTIRAPAMCRLQGAAAPAPSTSAALPHPLPEPYLANPPLCSAAAVPGPCPSVTSPVTNQSYFLDTRPMDFATAEAACNINGRPPVMLLLSLATPQH